MNNSKHMIKTMDKSIDSKDYVISVEEYEIKSKKELQI